MPSGSVGIVPSRRHEREDNAPSEPEVAEKLLRPDVAERLRRARTALASGIVDYDEMLRR